jgi:hypothetical protein
MGVPALRGSARALTPEGHAWIRRQLALIPVYIYLAYGWRQLLLSLPLGVPGARVQLARDFMQFYLQGAIANARDAAALYDAKRWAVMLPRIVPVPSDLFLPIYGPQVSVLFSPLARLPYRTALTVWIIVSVVVYLACGYAVWRACPRLRGSGGTIALLLLADPALHYTLSFSQASPIGLVCVTAAFFALRADRPFAAGLAIGSLIYKPQLGIAFAVVFVAAREWRIVLGAVAGAALQFAVAIGFWGPSIVGEYVRSLQQLGPFLASPQFELYRPQMHSLRAFFEILGLPSGMAPVAYAVASGLTLALALRCWRRKGPLVLRYAALLFATILVDPHVYAYDLILLMPTFLLLWDWSLSEHNRSFDIRFEWLLYVCYLSPLFFVVALLAHIQISVLVSLGVMWCLVVALRRAEDVSIEATSVSRQSRSR